MPILLQYTLPIWNEGCIASTAHMGVDMGVCGSEAENGKQEEHICTSRQLYLVLQVETQERREKGERENVEHNTIAGCGGRTAGGVARRRME